MYGKKGLLIIAKYIQRNLSEGRGLFNTEKSNNTRVAARTGFCPPWLQSTHRVEMADFWRSFHHVGKISPGWWGWGVHPLSISLHLTSHTSCSVRSSWEGRHTPPIHLYPVSNLWSWLWVWIFEVAAWNSLPFRLSNQDRSVVWTIPFSLRLR